MWDYAGRRTIYSNERRNDGSQREGRVVTSSRIVLRLALGVLCGVALVLLPAVFSTGLASTSSTQSLGGATPPATFARASPSLFGLNSATIGGLSFLTIILFIFLPSTVFSLVVRRWAEKRARDYLWSD